MVSIVLLFGIMEVTSSTKKSLNLCAAQLFVNKTFVSFRSIFFSSSKLEKKRSKNSKNEFPRC